VAYTVTDLSSLEVAFHLETGQADILEDTMRKAAADAIHNIRFVQKLEPTQPVSQQPTPKPKAQNP